jgi:hypothetical protein
MKEHGVVLFFGTQAAIRAEKILKGAGHQVKLVPTPRQLSSDCGVALRFAWDEMTFIREQLAGAHVDFDRISSLD